MILTAQTTIWEDFINAFNSFSDARFIISAILFIAVIASIYYVMFAFLKGNNSANLIVVFTVLMLIGGVVFVCIDDTIFSNQAFIFVPLLFLLFVMFVFSAEIKRVFMSRKVRLRDMRSVVENIDEKEIETCIDEIIKAVQNMSKNDVGALTILSNSNIPTQVLDSGVRLNCDISASVVESIFFPKTPLHDGAMIIQKNKIQAAGCFLPLSQVNNLPKDLGTRHRAGIGITEAVDVTSIIVSEETGIISIVKAGKITRYADATILKNTLKNYYWQDFMSDRQRRF